MGELVGRESDCAKIDRLLEAAHGGASGSLVVRGEPGIGKTALLAYAADHADAMTVLRCTGVEGESDLVFAGLYGLVRPILGHLGEVADRQSAALAGALGLAPSAGPDRFLVSAALLSLLAVAAETRPVLCVVDDAQWLDTPSTGALVFTPRRLGAERIAMLFGAREGDPRRFDAPGLQELVLTGLDDGPAAVLLARRARGAAASVRERLLTEAAGNPLALLELPAGLSPRQLAGQDPLPDALPLTGRLQAAFEQRIARLPETAQMALLIAAADGTGEAAAVLGAAAQLGLPPDALDPAEKAGLIQIRAGTMVFRHPLVRSALHDAATLHQRQRAHRPRGGADRRRARRPAGLASGDGHTDRR